MESEIVNLLKEGKVGVMPTDTIYGLVGSALNPQTVEEIYLLRKRATDKPFIVLISSINDLGKFGVFLTKEQKEFLEKNWPNPLSVILPVVGEEYKYLHRGKNSIAFRMPNDAKLLETLKQTGPLVAPSANFEGEKAAETIEEAKEYFGGRAAFYLDEGRLRSRPSTVVRLYEDGTRIILREGSFKEAA